MGAAFGWFMHSSAPFCTTPLGGKLPRMHVNTALGFFPRSTGVNRVVWDAALGCGLSYHRPLFSDYGGKSLSMEIVSGQYWENTNCAAVAMIARGAHVYSVDF